MRTRTYQLNSGLAVTLSGTEQAVALPSDIANLAANRQNLVVFHFLLSGAAGDNATIVPEEFYPYLNTSGNQDVFGPSGGQGWGNVAKDDGTGKLTKQSFTANGETDINRFSVAVSTNAASMRVKVTGQGTLYIWATVSEVS